MTATEIALNTLETELKQYSQRPKPLGKTILDLIINQKDNSSLHSKYLNPLQNFFKKENTPNKEEYIKQVSNSYQVKKESKKYTQGKELKRLKDKIILDINLVDIKEESSLDTDILIRKDKLKDLKDFWPVTKIQSKHKDFYNIPLEAKQESVYFDLVGRQYNNFNRLSQDDRKLTNTPYEIDLSSSVQNLYINQYALINSISYEEALEQFPAHKEYIQNKKAIRGRLAEEQNKTIDEIKTELTKISFRGGKEQDYEGFTLKLFKETQELTKPILELINRMNDRLPIKKHITERAENKKIMKELKKINYRSKLFFWYEYQESVVRKSMLEFVNNPSTKQVHDAIYTEEEQDLNKIKKYVEKETGFTIIL